MFPRRILSLSLVLALLIVTISFSSTEAQESESTQGQIAYIGEDLNVYTYDVATQNITSITKNADDDTAYLWPTWSTDGQLAYFGVSSASDDPYQFGVFVHPDYENSTVVHRYTTDNDAFTYAYWAPSDCPESNCRDLAILYTSGDTGGLAVRRVRSFDEKFVVDEIDAGGPFYWDWSPDGQSMFWARYGISLELYDVAKNEVVEILPAEQGSQRSVDWSPVDDRLLTSIRETDGSSSLVIFNGDKQQVLLDDISSLVSFEWSPDASQVAAVTNRTGELSIIDVGKESIVATPAERVLAFTWSPLGDKIAYLTFGRAEEDQVTAKPSAQGGDPFLIWNIYDVETDESYIAATYLPTSQMIYYFEFFDQFIRSHSFWSPDGNYLVFSELTDFGPQVVMVDVTEPNGEQTVIDNGYIGVFSWE